MFAGNVYGWKIVEPLSINQAFVFLYYQLLKYYQQTCLRTILKHYYMYMYYHFRPGLRWLCLPSKMPFSINRIIHYHYFLLVSLYCVRDFTDFVPLFLVGMKFLTAELIVGQFLSRFNLLDFRLRACVCVCVSAAVPDDVLLKWKMNKKSDPGARAPSDKNGKKHSLSIAYTNEL